MSQIETTLEGLKGRSGDALEAVQQGVEVLGSKLGLIEPKPRHRRTPWVVFGLLAAVAITTIAIRRRSASRSNAETDRESSDRPSWSAAAS